MHPPDPATPEAGTLDAAGDRRTTWLLLGIILGAGLVLRLWDIDHALPFVYTADELRYFVPEAVRFVEEGYLPNRMGGNPPGLAYAFHAVYLAAFGGPEGILRAWQASPETLFLIGRVVSALSGVVAAWLIFLTGTRLFGRRAGLVAAGLMVIAFLPFVYSRRALADAAQLAPLALSLVGSAGILRRGRWTDYAIAGAGLGLATGTKYLSAIAALPLAAAILPRFVDRRAWRPALLGAAIAVGAALVGLFLTHPFLLLRWGEVASQVPGLAGRGGGGSPKVGIEPGGGVAYYLLVFTWGIGWVATGLAVVGAVRLVLRERWTALLLIPAIVAIVMFMGGRPRPFARYVLPAFPFVILLASAAAGDLLRRAERLSARARLMGVSLLVVALAGQPLVHVFHHLRAGGRTDTREIAAAWMRANVPRGEPILVEPMWIPLDQQTRHRNPRAGPQPDRSPWRLVDARALLREEGIALGRARGGGVDVVGSYRPELLDLLEGEGVCWVVTSSNQRGRVIRTPHLAPDAAAFYRELDRRARIVHSVVPPRGAGRRPPHQREWSGTFYDLTLERPGPRVDIHRLGGSRCEGEG